VDYIIDGKTLNLNYTDTTINLNQIIQQFSFTYEFLIMEKRKKVYADAIICERLLDNQEFKQLLCTPLFDYDEVAYVFSMLDKIVEPLYIPNLCCGSSEDKYFIDDIVIQGDNLSCEELSYENNLSIVSLTDINEDAISKIIAKNSYSDFSKEIYYISSKSPYYLINNILSDSFQLEFFLSFPNVFLKNNTSIYDWNSITKRDRKTILSTFSKEIEHIINNNFSALGHTPGNGNRIENLSNILSNCYGYRILNPNYRIYFLKEKDNVVILLGRLKRENQITEHVKSRIRSIASS